MNNIRLLVLLGIVSASVCGAVAGVGMDVNFSGLKQSPNPTFKTNANNINAVTQITKREKFEIDTAKLLQMLANSLDMEFSRNASLTFAPPSFFATQQSGFFVIDGTNSIDVSPVLTLENTNLPISSSSFAFLQVTNSDFPTTNSDLTIGIGGVFQLLHFSSKGTSLVTLKYDDSDRQTRDGNTTSFFLTGLQTLDESLRFGGRKAMDSVITEFNGAGQGTFFSSASTVPFILTGKFSNVVIFHQ